MTPSPFRIERREDAAAVLVFDLPDEKLNVLRPELEEPLETALRELEEDSAVRAVVLASGKPESFVVGADVAMLRSVDTEEEATELARGAQRLMDRIEEFGKPIVCAIHGDCVGGGLEIALACDGRVASDAEVTKLGLPEVQLGLLPGAGGTQRLPRLVGLEEALKLILTGRRLDARRARKIGLVDEVVHPAIVVEIAAERALAIASGATARSRDVDLKAVLLEQNPVGRRVLFRQAEKQIRDRTGDRMPAPYAALEAVRTGVEEGRKAGSDREAREFGRLAVTPQSRALTDLFLWQRQLRGESGVDDASVAARQVSRVGILGAGLMGAGIARATAERAELPVRLKDLDWRALRSGLSAVRRDLDARVEKGRMRAVERDRVLNRIHPTIDYSGFGSVDVVIEAVVEKLEVKHAVRDEVERHGGEETIFATNTSSLPITRIAEGAAAPERVVGMHYFSPVDKVPLLEVVVGEETAPWVTATVVELGKAQGKTVIVVNDGPGFYTTRILGPYLNEAVRLVAEGVPIGEVDRALTGFGFPVGPLKLLDEVGIDTGEKIGEILHAAFGERMAPAAAQEKVAHDERQGRKNGRGFYRYEETAAGGYERSGGPDDSVYEILGVEPREGVVAAEEIVDRCALLLANEAVRCLDEGIVRSVRDADVGAVFGLGFPPEKGGPLRWIDTRGPRAVKARLEALAEKHGDRFAPADLLKRHAEERKHFHE